jgi:hypothetical protein
LIDKYLKLYFKYPGVFHKPVEKPVENFPGKTLKRDQEGAFTTLPLCQSKKSLSKAE